MIKKVFFSTFFAVSSICLNANAIISPIYFSDFSSLSGRTSFVEGEKNYHIQTALSGFKKDDIKLELDGESLIVRAENKKKNASYSSSFVLPQDADDSKITSSFDDGVLNILIEKTGVKKPQIREIKIK